MLYERSLAIENRLQTVLQLIETGEYATHELADKVGVSIPTISRDVMALRQRGYAIRAERQGLHWHYTLAPANSQPRGQATENTKRKPR